MKYTKHQSNELVDFIYNSCMHDSVLVGVTYDASKKKTILILDNHYFSRKMYFEFEETVLFMQRNNITDEKLDENHYRTINYIGIEENTNGLPRDLDIDDRIYILIQFFSMDEIHIVANSVEIK